MKKTDVGEVLNSIGKRTFIKYYENFKDLDISNQEMIERLGLDPKGFSPFAKASKTSKARKIFREGLEIQALLIIVDSRADLEAVEKARKLLDMELENKDLDIENPERQSFSTVLKKQTNVIEQNRKILEMIAKLKSLPFSVEVSEQIKMLESLI